MNIAKLRSGVAASALALGILVTGAVAVAVVSSPAISAPAEQTSNIILPQAEFEQAAKASGAKIIDARTPAEYAKGHIPGAINLPWVKLNVGEEDGIRNELSSDAELAKQFGLAGLSYDDTVLIYDATTLSGRAYIAFDYAGFKKVHVLDGGIGSWTGALTKEATVAKPTTFALSQKRENRVQKDYVATKVGSSDVVIVDGRVTQAFEDGHIPTAKVFPANEYVGKGTFRRDRKDLLKDLAAKGITPDKQVVSYCGSGMAAANAFLVLKDLGFDKLVLYDGSWDDWSRDPKAGQEVSLPNYSLAAFSSDKSSVGPRLLTEAEVKDLQKKPDVVVLDVRAPADYVVGRIPNSVNVYWNDTLDKDRVVKSRDDLVALYKAKGVTPDKHVVIFTRGGLQATHTFTLLKLLGYQNVDVFAGKWEGWLNPAFTKL
jgi:thiosulfate/3-mercaptopyruvate sulfurtransferase